MRRKLVQARQAALWLSGQVDATGAELDRARDETLRMAAMCDQLSLRKCARGGDVCATDGEESLAEVTAMVAECIELGTDAAVAAAGACASSASADVDAGCAVSARPPLA